MRIQNLTILAMLAVSGCSDTGPIIPEGDPANGITAPSPYPARGNVSVAIDAEDLSPTFALGEEIPVVFRNNSRTTVESGVLGCFTRMERWDPDNSEWSAVMKTPGNCFLVLANWTPGARRSYTTEGPETRGRYRLVETMTREEVGQTLTLRSNSFDVE